MDELRNARWRDIPVVGKLDPAHLLRLLSSKLPFCWLILHVALAAMSAESKQEAVLEALKGGAQDYLVKPVRRNELLTLWQHIWRRHQIQASRDGQPSAALLTASEKSNSPTTSANGAAAAAGRPTSPMRARISVRRAASLPASLIDAAADAALSEAPTAPAGPQTTATETILPGAHGLIPAASIPAVLAHPQIDLSIKPLDLGAQSTSHPQPLPLNGNGWNRWSEAQMRWMEAQHGNGHGLPGLPQGAGHDRQPYGGKALA